MRVSPDDSIAEALSKSLDVKWMQYWGKTTEGGGIAPTAPPYSFTYTVHISREQKGLAEVTAAAVNKVLVQEHTENRVCVVFTETIPAGGTEELFRLQNYYREDASLADYAKLRCLIINGTDQGDPDSIYNDPETYQNFPDIKYLKISKKIQKAAEEKGIDWYEYWPELEEVEVY